MMTMKIVNRILVRALWGATIFNLIAGALYGAHGDYARGAFETSFAAVNLLLIKRLEE